MNQSIKERLLSMLERTEIEDIVKHGCSGGIGGFIYYRETSEFHEDFEDEIWQMIYEDSKDEGMTSMEFIASLNGSKDVGGMHQLKNLLCWYAVERVCREILESDL